MNVLIVEEERRRRRLSDRTDGSVRRLEGGEGEHFAGGLNRHEKSEEGWIQEACENC
jgi:hypothetical protein